jgi:copper chaperone
VRIEKALTFQLVEPLRSVVRPHIGPKSVEQEKAMVIKLDVDGVHCGSCASRITQAIQKVGPGARVKVTVETGTVEVEAALDRALIVKAIEGAGYLLRKAD